MKSDTLYADFVAFLKNTERDALLFSDFKRDRQFMETLEHVGQRVGGLYHDLVRTEFNVDPSDYHDIIDLNDSIGNPVKYVCGRKAMSPTNLRYLYHALLIKRKCDKWFTNKRIRLLEIGGGYGGLCLFIKRIFKDYDIEYTIIDLPESGVLQTRYLSAVGQSSTRIVSCFDLDSLSSERFDLVVSNYCMSEISEDNKNQYFETLIRNCDKKFFVWNYLTIEGDSPIWNNWRAKKLLAIFGMYPPIKYVDRAEYVFESERPQTGGINTFIYSK